MNYTEEFIKAGKFDTNSMFIKDNLLLECLMGSQAYGTNNEDSDYDVVGVFMDRQQDLYPQQYGMILGFDNQNRFESKELKNEKKIVLENGKDCEAECLSMRRGEWGTFAQLEEHFNKKMSNLNELSLKLSLPQQPRTGELHSLLQNCIEQYFGSLDKSQKQIEYISTKDVMDKLSAMDKDLKEIKKIVIPS